MSRLHGHAARALLAGAVAALAIGPATAGERLHESRGAYALSEPFEDFYDSAFIWTDAGRAAPRRLDERELARRLGRYDVVFYGEIHGHPGVHRRELALLRALVAERPHWVLALEPFERDVQDSIDQYLAGRIGEMTLLGQARAWDNYATSYRPLVVFAQRHALPVVAAEAPDWTIACVGALGPEVLDRFTPLERGWVARELHVTEGAYRDRYLQFASGAPAHGGGAANSPEAVLKTERSFAAQAARDDTMAESIADALRVHPGYQVLHVTGKFHAAGFLGTVERLRLRNPALTIAVVEAVEVDDPRAPSFAAAEAAEATVLQLVYPLPESFAAGEDQSQWAAGVMARRGAHPCKYAPAGAAPLIAPTGATAPP